jgi:hypothetical protein
LWYLIVVMVCAERIARHNVGTPAHGTAAINAADLETFETKKLMPHKPNEAIKTTGTTAKSTLSPVP